MKRKVLSLSLALLLATSNFMGCSGNNSGEGEESPQTTEPTVTPGEAENVDTLVFPVDEYTEVTETVETGTGTKNVTYRYYKHICYVANPVDTDYQSMNVKVPIQIDGTDIDAANAPIVFINSVGGYMSASNSEDESQQNSFTEDLMNKENGSTTGTDDAAGTATDDAAGTATDDAAGTGTEDAAGTGTEDAAGTATDDAAGTATDDAAGTATDNAAAGDESMKKDGNDAGKGGMGMHAGNDELNVNGSYALAAGYVVVEPGCRGRDNVDENGNYYGKAPAAIVDLKAAVRYLRHNDDIMPGNAELIVSSGVSAGGAMSALLGASGDSDLYDAYLDELGAADASDAIFAAACYCPILDLEHADMAYEWMLGNVEYNGSAVDANISKQLSDAFTEYQTSLNYTGRGDFGTITADNYDVYILDTYLIPAANKYISGLSDTEREAYLKERPWITWKDNTATFTFEDFVSYIGREKGAPSFDAFDLSSGENILFGTKDTDARHFTDFGVANNTADGGDGEIDEELQTIINMMNPMYFINEDNPKCAQYWWIRYGTNDTNTAHPVIVNLDLGLYAIGKDVDTLMYWDAGHGANQDPDDFIAWIADITGYK